MALPLRAGTVDVVVTDLPFGKRCWVSWVHLFYPRVLYEMGRVTRAGGRAVLLDAATNEHKIRKALGRAPLDGMWSCVGSIPINHGGFLCVVIVLMRKASTREEGVHSEGNFHAGGVWPQPLPR
jgi:hypothetical protein